MDNEIITVKELIAKVAEKHKVLLSDEDPILVTVTLNELILKNYIDANIREIEKLKISLSSIYSKQEEQAAVVVKTIMDQCLETARVSLENSAKKASDDIKTALRTQQNLVVDRNNKLIKDIKFSRNITFLCALFSLGVLLLFGVVFFL